MPCRVGPSGDAVSRHGRERRPTRRPFLGALMATVLAVPVAAQDYPEEYDPSVLQGCLDATWFRDGPLSECIGVGAAHCLQSEAGGSNIGIGYCFGAEWQQWDGLLNQTYQTLLAEQAAADADMMEFNEALAVGEETLRDMQRAWIAYRDAACAFEYAQWGGGTGGGPASAQCHMELTARQTLFLMERLQ